MNESNKFLDDVARMFGNALGVVGSAKTEFEAAFRHKLEVYLSSMDLVKREEFDVLKDMLTESRIEQETLKQRLDKLENKRDDK
jgi:hypothetical protein